jgi:Lar family restriction alleviation protein
MKTEQIKSCPFCGSKKIEVSRTNPNACWITCGNENCGAESKSHPTRVGAIRNWNRRAKVTTTETKIVYDMDAEQAARLVA